jgi:hypothetical protein
MDQLSWRIRQQIVHRTGLIRQQEPRNNEEKHITEKVFPEYRIE